jgi:hypothetical protein
MIRMKSVKVQRQTGSLQDAARREAVTQMEVWSVTSGKSAGKAARGLTDERVNRMVHEAR